MHQNKFVTDFFIKRLPQYAVRHFLTIPPDDGNIEVTKCVLG
jgi:hypothetical protein